MDSIKRYGSTQDVIDGPYVQSCKSLHITAYQWKLTSENKLINQNGDWKYQDYQWKIPERSNLRMPGYIEVQDSNMFDSKFKSSGNVLSCVDSFDVVLSTKGQLNSD